MSTPARTTTEHGGGDWRLAVCGIRIECGILRFAAIIIAALPRPRDRGEI